MSEFIRDILRALERGMRHKPQEIEDEKLERKLEKEVAKSIKIKRVKTSKMEEE